MDMRKENFAEIHRFIEMFVLLVFFVRFVLFTVSFAVVRSLINLINRRLLSVGLNFVEMLEYCSILRTTKILDHGKTSLKLANKFIRRSDSNHQVDFVCNRLMLINLLVQSKTYGLC